MMHYLDVSIGMDTVCVCVCVCEHVKCDTFIIIGTCLHEVHVDIIVDGFIA